MVLGPTGAPPAQGTQLACRVVRWPDGARHRILGARCSLPGRTGCRAEGRADLGRARKQAPRLLGGMARLRDRLLCYRAARGVAELDQLDGEFILADYVKVDAAARIAASGGALDMSSLITAFYGNFQFW